MAKNVVVIDEDDSGRNQQFKNLKSGKTMSRMEFVKQVEKGKFPDYHIRKINGIKTPVSNPDKSEGNNLD